MPIPIEDQFPRRRRRNSMPDLAAITARLLENSRPTQSRGLPPLTRGFGPLDQNYFNRWEGHPRNNGGGGGPGLFGGLNNWMDELGASLSNLMGGNRSPVGDRRSPVGNPGGGQGLSPVQVALAQLDQLVNSGMQLPQGPSEADLQQALDEAAAGIQKQFGAQIGAIRAQMGGARKDTRQGSRAVRNMYNQLGNSYNRMGQRQFKQGSKLAHQLQGMGEREGDVISDQAQDIVKAGVRGAAGLGLGDLAMELTKQTKHDAGDLAQKAVRQGANAARTEKRVGANNRTFMQTSGQASRLEGTNTAADMYAQLQDYLQQNRSQIASLAGERAAAIAASKAGIQSSFADASADYADMRMDARQDLIDNKMDLLKLALEIKADQKDNRSGGGAQNRIEKFYEMLPDQQAEPFRILNRVDDPTVTNLYQKLSGRGSMQRGFTGSGDNRQTLEGNVANMQDWVSDVIGNDAWGGLSNAQRNALVAALLSQLEGMAG